MGRGMASRAPAASPASPSSGPDSDYLAEPGILGWLFTLDHKRQGLALGALLLLVFLGGAALVAAIEAGWHGALLPTAEAGADLRQRLLTLHGGLMVHALLAAAIPGTLGVFLLPLQVGARNLALPKLNLLSVHFWTLGAAAMLASAWAGGSEIGYALKGLPKGFGSLGAQWFLLGVALLATASLLRALALLVTAVSLRRPDLDWSRTPVFVWALVGQSLVVMLAAPVLLFTLATLAGDAWLGMGLFDASLGGDPVLLQHLVWWPLHSLIYASFLPAVGVMGEVVPVFSGRPLVGRQGLAFGLVVLGVLALLSWGEHLYASGQSVMVSSLFSLASLGMVVPAVLILRSLVGTTAGGQLRLTAPMILGAGFVTTFVFGGLAGTVLGMLATGVHLHGSTFVVGHLHYLLVGGVVTAWLAGLHYWWSRMLGRQYGEGTATLGAWLWVGGLHLAYFPLLLAGARGPFSPQSSGCPGYRLAPGAVEPGGRVARGGRIVTARKPLRLASQWTQGCWFSEPLGRDRPRMVSTLAAPGSPSCIAKGLRPAPGRAARPHSMNSESQQRLQVVFKQHYRNVWRFLRRLGVPLQAADDAAQQVFVVAVARIDDIVPGSERAFLYATASRTASRFVRKLTREPATDQGELMVSESPGPEELADERRARAALDRVLDGMSEDLRVAFVLFDIESVSMREIATILGIPPGTVASRIRRAREQFERLAQSSTLGRSEAADG